MTTATGATGTRIGFGSGWDERQPVIVLLDTSASMNRPAHDPPIASLNRALTRGFDAVRDRDRLRSRVEVCLVAFDSRVRVFDIAAGAFRPPEEADREALFSPLDGLRPPELTAGGYTCMVPALRFALDLARRRHRDLSARQVPVVRPLIWLLTDGAPSDEAGARLGAAEIAATAEQLRQAEHDDECVLFVIGVRGADREVLEVLAPQATHLLEDLDFGRILDIVFQSSDRTGHLRATEISDRLRTHAENARTLDSLEGDHR
ncbi:vWA domain-containing protein [Kitasatospora sp. NPDC001574]